MSEANEENEKLEVILATETKNLYNGLVGFPVSVQLKDPIAAHVSREEVTVSVGESRVLKTGRATPAEVPIDVGNPDAGTRPIVLQILEGCLKAVDHRGIALDMMAPDGRTPMLLLIRYEQITCLFYAPQHVDAGAPRIILPGVN